MIEIKIELNNWGLGEKSTLATIEIINIGTGTKGFGNYRYEIKGKRNIIKKGFVFNFPRLELNSIRLLERVLDDAYKEKTYD